MCVRVLACVGFRIVARLVALVLVHVWWTGLCSSRRFRYGCSARWPASCAMAELDWTDTEAAYLQEILHPLALRHLGHLALAASVEDELGRYAAFKASVSDAYGEDIDEASFRTAYSQVLADWPALLGLAGPASSPRKAVMPVQVAGPVCHVCTAPACGKPLGVIKEMPSTFLTLARGIVKGTVAISRCSDPRCGSAHCGPWRWDGVSREDEQGSSRQGLPGSHWHKPICVLDESSVCSCRWFFTDPSFIVEVALVNMLVGLMCRGGLSLTAFHNVYVANSEAVNVPDSSSPVRCCKWSLRGASSASC